jgi:hypothetical protein
MIQITGKVAGSFLPYAPNLSRVYVVGILRPLVGLPWDSPADLSPSDRLIKLPLECYGSLLAAGCREPIVSRPALTAIERCPGVMCPLQGASYHLEGIGPLPSRPGMLI